MSITSNITIATATGGTLTIPLTVNTATAMPTGNITVGSKTWVPYILQDFNTAVPLGGFSGSPQAGVSYPGNAAYPLLSMYPEASGNGKYLPSKTMSVHDGMLDIYVHDVGTQAAGAAMALTQPNGNWAYTGGRFSIRFRADISAASYGTAIELWPNSDVWADGEIDFPEGDFGGGINMYQHNVGANPGTNYRAHQNLTADWSAWHIATIEWIVGTSITYYLDGAQFEQITDPTQIATSPHNWVIQTASHGGDNTASPTAQGHLQIDWYTIHQ